MKNILKSEGGFTLVELLGVVAIIAVLATVAITSINGAIQAGRESAALRQVQTLNSAYQSHLAAGGNHAGTDAPAAVTALNAVIMLAGQPVGPFLPNGANLNVTRGTGAAGVITFNSAAGGFALPVVVPPAG